MASIAYVHTLGRPTVHISVAEGKWLNDDLHTTTLCGERIVAGYWREAPRPTETGFESDFRRCKKCASKKIEGTPAFDYDPQEV